MVDNFKELALLVIGEQGLTGAPGQGFGSLAYVNTVGRMIAATGEGGEFSTIQAGIDDFGTASKPLGEDKQGIVLIGPGDYPEPTIQGKDYVHCISVNPRATRLVGDDAAGVPMWIQPSSGSVVGITIRPEFADKTIGLNYVDGAIPGEALLRFNQELEISDLSAPFKFTNAGFMPDITGIFVHSSHILAIACKDTWAIRLPATHSGIVEVNLAGVIGNGAVTNDEAILIEGGALQISMGAVIDYIRTENAGLIAWVGTSVYLPGDVRGTNNQARLVDVRRFRYDGFDAGLAAVEPQAAIDQSHSSFTWHFSKDGIAQTTSPEKYFVGHSTGGHAVSPGRNRVKTIIIESDVAPVNTAYTVRVEAMNGAATARFRDAVLPIGQTHVEVDVTDSDLNTALEIRRAVADNWKLRISSHAADALLSNRPENIRVGLVGSQG